MYGDIRVQIYGQVKGKRSKIPENHNSVNENNEYNY